MAKIYLDCRGTLDLFGNHLVTAARASGNEIVVWSWAGARAAEETAHRFFDPEEYTTASKDYDAPKVGDIVVDDDETYWSEVCDATYYTPQDFIEVMKGN